MNSSREGEERSETECVREDRVTGGTGTWQDEVVSCHLVVEKLKNKCGISERNCISN